MVQSHLRSDMLKISHLRKKYGTHYIFEEANATFHKNKVNFILGENGSGKTTLFKCILGLENYEGEITFNESPLSNAVNQERIFCVFDDTPLYQNLTGFDNMKMYQTLYHTSSEIEYKFLSKELLSRKVKTYSYGERKKLYLELVHMIQPNILLMDEISNGLDYQTLKYLKKKLIEWKKNSLIIMSGHQLEFYDSLVEEIFVLNHRYLQNVDKEKLGDIYEQYIVNDSI